MWANGERVGRWVVPASGPMELTYDDAWVASESGRPVSLSLPMNLDGQALKGERVASFFDNLLPDSEAIRQRVRSRFRTRGVGAFDLLEAIGRDCVGALQLLPEGETPRGVTTISATPLSVGKVERLLRIAAGDGPSVRVDEDEDELRISLAGAQEKTALLWHEDRWCLPRGATPTTHLFKLPLGLVGGRQLDLRESLENEWLCGRLLAAYGVPVASSSLRQFGEQRALVVERFDRSLHSSGRYWLRLPQEDLCQATGTPGVSKYESDGGPGLVEIARVLQGSEARADDLATLLRAQLLFWMLAATDGHAKNFSLRLLARGAYRLTPLYDVISAWPVAGNRHDQVHPRKLKLAMALRGGSKHYRVAEMRLRHFEVTAKLCGAGPAMAAIVDDVLSRTDSVIDAVGARLPGGFPERVFAAVTGGLRASAAALRAQRG